MFFPSSRVPQMGGVYLDGQLHLWSFLVSLFSTYFCPTSFSSFSVDFGLKLPILSGAHNIQPINYYHYLVSRFLSFSKKKKNCKNEFEKIIIFKKWLEFILKKQIFLNTISRLFQWVTKEPHPRTKEQEYLPLYSQILQFSCTKVGLVVDLWQYSFASTSI